MLVTTENLQTIQVEMMANELMSKFDFSQYSDVTEEKAKEALSSMYYQSSLLANKNIMNDKLYEMPIAKLKLQNIDSINKIWEKVKLHFCNLVKPESTQEVLVKAIIIAIALIMPLSIIIEALIIIIIDYFLSRGIEEICSIN